MTKAFLRLTEPEVIHVRADLGETDGPYVRWVVNYSPATPADSLWTGRVVIAKVDVASKTATASVTVAAFLELNAPEVISPELYESALRGSDALDTLWHFARVALAPSMALIRSDLSIPLESPEPTTREL
jgi:hypothetical protein